VKNLIDLHTHSVLSKHGFSSLTENIEYAKRKGLKYYGISDHQNDEKGVGAHIYAFHNLRVLPKYVDDLRLLKGIECNMLEDGTIDKSGQMMSVFDYVICSLHGYMYKDQGYEKNTENYLKVLDDEDVLILGHIEDNRTPCDFEKVIKKAKELHKLVEFNNSSLGETSPREKVKENMLIMLDLCKKYNQPIIINSDAHVCYDVGETSRVDELIKESNFPINMILNYNEDLINEYLKK